MPTKGPAVYYTGISGTIWCATRWTQRKDGIRTASVKHDVTHEVLQAVVGYFEDNDVIETDKDGKRYRLVLSREPITEAVAS